MLPAVTDNVADNIGSTPMVKLAPQNKGLDWVAQSRNDKSNSFTVNILAKLEFTNPTGSGKDRLARYILTELEKKNPFDTNKTRTLIIPTSGNLSIALASLAASQYRVIAILPERISNDRISLLKALGVEILRTPNEVLPSAPESAFTIASKLAEQLKDATVIDETQLAAAYHPLAEEILQQTSTVVDYVFVGAESGATIMGIAQYLKSKIPTVKVVGVEPTESVFGGADHHLSSGSRCDWKVEDLGSNFIPPQFNKSLVDEWIKVSDKESFSVARRLIKEKGILCGPASGAMVAAATRHAQGQLTNHSTHTPQYVVILNDRATNFSSTLLSDDWLFEHDLADDLITTELEYVSQNRYRAASVEDLQLPAAVTIAPSSSVSHAMDLMLEREYSQLPVIKKRKLVGYVSLSALQDRLEKNNGQLTDSVESCMYAFNKKRGGKYEVITPDTSLAELAKFFEKNSFAVVTDANRKWCLGVATKYDLISFLHRRQNL